VNDPRNPLIDLPLDHHCQVLAKHDKFDIFAFEKAAGVQTQPSKKKSSKGRSLLKANYCEEDEKYLWSDADNKTRSLFLVHRLDAPTSGILLATTCEKWAITLRESFANREISKTYHAVVKAHANSRTSYWRDYLVKESKNGIMRVKRHKSGKLATSSMKVERVAHTSGSMIALIKLNPETGRTHQLRVQCASRGMPIIGDRTYGDFSLNRKIAKKTKVDRMFLHATCLSLEINKPGMPKISWEIDSSLPRDFIRFVS